MFVMPKPGMRIRDPAKRDVLPGEGREVDAHDPYWLRRLADGDVTTVAPVTAKKSSVVLTAPAKGATEP